MEQIAVAAYQAHGTRIKEDEIRTEQDVALLSESYNMVITAIKSTTHLSLLIFSTAVRIIGAFLCEMLSTATPPAPVLGNGRLPPPARPAPPFPLWHAFWSAAAHH